MIGQDLKDFINGALDAGRLTMLDVDRLLSELLPDGVRSRADADALAAVDRLVADKHPSWDDAFVDLVAPFVTADAEATRDAERDTVNWLMTTLDAAGAMTDNGLRIAIEVTRAASHIDQTLITFVLQTVQSRRPAVRCGDIARHAPAADTAPVAQAVQPSGCEQSTAGPTLPDDTDAGAVVASIDGARRAA